MNTGQKRLRPSSIPRWLQCAEWAYSRFTQDQTDTPSPNVGAFVGLCAHAHVAQGADPELPDPMKWDDITPTEKIARAQAVKIGEAVNKAVRDEGWYILDQEVPVEMIEYEYPVRGRLDMVARTLDKKIVIADIKTGPTTDGAWYQLGAYAAALSSNPPGHIRGQYAWDAENAMVAVIHAPRRRVYEVEEVRIDMRPAREIALAAQHAISRIHGYLEGALTRLPTPGSHCAWCSKRNECAVSSWRDPYG